MKEKTSESIHGSSPEPVCSSRCRSLELTILRELYEVSPSRLMERQINQFNCSNKLPLIHVVGLVDGSESADVVRPVQLHPIVHDVVVEAVEPFNNVRGAVFSRSVLDVVAETFHLRLHVLWLEKG